YDDLRSWNICKSCKSRFPGISRRSGQDNNILSHIVFLRSCCQEMRQNGERHILKRDRCTMEEFQMICIFYFDERSDHLCVKFRIICTVYAVFQLLLRKIREELLHDS